MENAQALTRGHLEVMLARERYRPDTYRLYGGQGIGECYVLDQTPTGWEVYYAERGTKGGLQRFGTEGEACAYFLALLRSDAVARRA